MLVYGKARNGEHKVEQVPGTILKHLFSMLSSYKCLSVVHRPVAIKVPSGF